MLWFKKHCKWIDGPRGGLPAPKVAFFKAYPWHSTILQPIAAELFSDIDLVIASRGRELAAQRPDVVVVADAGVIPFLREVMPQAIYVHVCHGFISKNQPSYNYRHADYICVSSQYMASRLQEAGSVPKCGFWSTGLPAMDAISQKLDANSSEKKSPWTLIYAPTWNPSLSSAEMFSESLVEQLRGDQDWSIYIKPHPHTAKSNPEWIALWAELGRKNRNVVLLEGDEALAPYARLADVMVSDASSASFLFLALNRPIILLNNPRRLNDLHAYDPEGIEWKWRDMAEELSNPSEVYPKLKELLSGGDKRMAIRQAYRQKIFDTHLDGNCSRRIASKILELTLDLAKRRS